MENKLESPDYQMDISETGTLTADNISTSSASPTISNQAESDIGGEKSNGIDRVLEPVSKMKITTKNDEDSMKNRNTLTLDTSHHNQQPQKLTPVHHHPLMFDDDNESEDSCNNSQQLSNYPDVVLAHHQPLRLNQLSAKSHATVDIVNSVNNNNGTKSTKKPIYREPSPVSNFFIYYRLQK